MMQKVRSNLTKYYDEKLVDKLLEAYTEAKRNYYLDELRPNEVEGGRFCEAAFRMLQQRTTKKYTPLGKKLPIEDIIEALRNIQNGQYPDSIRLHIPRSLRVIYDIRNNRDAAHLADGIDPNLQDANLVISVLDWILAEFIRLHHNVSADEAQRIVEELVTRQAPVVQEFKGFPKILNPNIGASDYVLVLLYHKGQAGAKFSELNSWVRPKMQSNLKRTMTILVDNKAFVHFDERKYQITRLGMKEVEKRKLLKQK